MRQLDRVDDRDKPGHDGCGLQFDCTFQRRTMVKNNNGRIAVVFKRCKIVSCMVLPKASGTVWERTMSYGFKFSDEGLNDGDRSPAPMRSKAATAVAIAAPLASSPSLFGGRGFLYGCGSTIARGLASLHLRDFLTLFIF